MKKSIAVVLALILMMAYTQGLGEGGPEALTQSQGYKGYEVLSEVEIPGGTWAFGTLKKGRENALAGFEKVDGQWIERIITKAALPQGDMRYTLVDVSGTSKFSLKGEFQEDYPGEVYGKAFAMGWSNGEYWENAMTFEQDKEGMWRLVFYAHNGQSGMIDIAPKKDGKSATFYFLEESEDRTRYDIPFDSDLRTFMFTLLPKTPEQAAQPLALPPVIPTGWLSAREVPLEGDQLIPVYTSPHDKPYRAAKGKAALSPAAWVQVFGVNAGYAMVQYAISPGQYRIGYIDTKHLPDWYEPLELKFKRTSAIVDTAYEATDDPLKGRSTLFSLKKGQEVTLLSKMGNDAYFETYIGNQVARAFAPLGIFSADPQPEGNQRAMMSRAGEETHEVMLTQASLSPLPYALYVDLGGFYVDHTLDSVLIAMRDKPFEEDAYIILRTGGKEDLDRLETEMKGNGFEWTAWDWPLVFGALPREQRETYLLRMQKGNQLVYALALYQLDTPLLMMIYTPANLMQTWGQHLFDMAATLEITKD